jgi:Fic family protein
MQDSPELTPAKIAELPPPKLNYALLLPELTAAHAAVGKLGGLLSALPNPDILIAPFRKREAVASSAIEGTRATLEEVLEFEALEESKVEMEDEIKRRKIDDITEIVNYENAVNIALEELKTRPIGENLLKRTHDILLLSGRGANKDRGNFRRTQVRVGDYIPPLHTEVLGLIANWEKYLNSDQESDPLIRIGVAHYQFEAIHPFLDGNGRIGRLIVPLFLCQVEMLQAPVLYISHHLEQHKREYQTLLHRVDTNQEWIPWLKGSGEMRWDSR